MDVPEVFLSVCNRTAVLKVLWIDRLQSTSVAKKKACLRGGLIYSKTGLRNGAADFRQEICSKTLIVPGSFGLFLK